MLGQREANDEKNHNPLHDRQEQGGSGRRAADAAKVAAFRRRDADAVDMSATAGTSSPSIEANRPPLNLSESVLDRIREMDQDLENGMESGQLSYVSSGTQNPVKKQTHNRLFSQLFGYYPDSLLFAARISISFALASLFLLAFPLDSPWYESSWVYITVGVVSWNATIDSGTTMRKLIERTIGTCVGAALAFPVGFASLAIAKGSHGTAGQAAFLGVTLVLHGFLFPYVADRLSYRGSYAAILGCMTFGIAVFPFYSDPETTSAPWELAAWRIINILLGSVIAGIVSFVVYPISTQTLVLKTLEDLKKSTGNSTEMILVAAASSFSGSGCRPRPLAEVLTSTSAAAQRDEIHALYAKNMEKWKSARALIPLLAYDPWFWKCRSDERRLFQQQMILQIAQTFRIQLSAILLDSMVRSDLMYHQATDYTGSDSLQMLRDIGGKISLIMDTKIEENQRATALKDLVENDWRVLEMAIDSLHSRMHSFSSPGKPAKRVSLKGVSHLESELKDKPFLPLSTIDYQGEQSVFFLQIVQQLILRVAKLHFNQTAYSRPRT